MTIDVQKRIAKKRGACGEEAMTEHHVKNKYFLSEDVDLVASWMTTAVLSLLSEMLSEEKSYQADLKSGLHRSFRRLLRMVENRSERVVFLHEAIPGFTALSVRKDGWDSIKQPSAPEKTAKSKNKALLDSSETNGSLESEALEKERAMAVQSIVSAYIKRTGNRVISIDGKDITLILFPVEDLKQNLLEMGFWDS